MSKLHHLLTRFRHSSFDLIVLRLSVIAVFLGFGVAKWFEFEVQLLKPLISPTWLRFLYDWFGYHGASYFLGIVEGIAYIGLIVGFWKPSWSIVGALVVFGTACVTLSMMLQLGFHGFIFKDILLIGAALVLLKADLNRLSP